MPALLAAVGAQVPAVELAVLAVGPVLAVEHPLVAKELVHVPVPVQPVGVVPLAVEALVVPLEEEVPVELLEPATDQNVFTRPKPDLNS